MSGHFWEFSWAESYSSDDLGLQNLELQNDLYHYCPVVL